MVRAVSIIITHPAEGDAGGALALELMDSAGRRCTLQLVTTITAVILTIADKALGNTLPTAACEVCWTASHVAWGKGSKRG